MSTDKKPDGGCAYPLPYLSKNQDNGELTYHESIGGMTLRDKFAGDALIGLLSDSDGPRQGDEDPSNLCVRYAKRAYEYADAMIAARAV